MKNSSKLIRGTDVKNNLEVWFSPSNLDEAAPLVIDVLKSGFVNDGPKAREFEEKICEITDRTYGVMVPNATLGIWLALMASGLRPGARVAIPAFSFIATANAVVMAGFQPLFIDINGNDFLIDARTLTKSKILEANVEALVVVEVNGRMPNYAPIAELCDELNISLITDSAESLGSRSSNGKAAGSFGNFSVISFSPNKVITSGQGGVVLTDCADLYERLMEIKLQGNAIRGDGGSDEFHTFGTNLKFTDLQAAVALSQLKHLKNRLRHIGWLRDTYIEYFERFGVTKKYGVRFPELNKGAVPLWVDVLVDQPSAFKRFLEDKKIGFRDFWIPMPIQKSYGLKTSDFPIAKSVSDHGIWLSSNFNIQEKDFVEVFGE